jgi:hypothetical protein
MLMTCGVYFFSMWYVFGMVLLAWLSCGFGVGVRFWVPLHASLSVSVVTGLDLEGEGGRVA